MRKLSAILLICLFTFSQYARQLSYLECKFSNALKPGTAKCDCEKQSGLDKIDTDQSSAPKTHNHIHLDEFFSVAKETILSPSYTAVLKSKTYLPGNDECEGINSLPWQPPNS